MSRVDSASAVTSSVVRPTVEIGGKTAHDLALQLQDFYRRTFYSQFAAVHPCPTIKQSPVILADNSDNGHLRLDGEVESTFLEREQSGIGRHRPRPFGKYP